MRVGGEGMVLEWRGLECFFLLWARAHCAPGPSAAEPRLSSAPSIPPMGLGKWGSAKGESALSSLWRLLLVLSGFG